MKTKLSIATTLFLATISNINAMETQVSHKNGCLVADIQAIDKALNLEKGTGLYELGLRSYEETEAKTRGSFFVDQSKALQYFLNAMDTNVEHAGALYKTGYIYFYGEGVRKNRGLGLALIHRSSDLGNADAMHCLGFIHYGDQGVKGDINEAHRYYNMAAELGHVKSYAELGGLYLRGYGVDQDISMGLFYNHKAITITPKWMDPALKKLLTFAPEELDVSTKLSLELISELTSFRIVGDIYGQLKICDALRNEIKELNDLQKQELAKTYEILLNFFDESKNSTENIIENFGVSGFGISCLKPTEKFLEEYKEHTKGDKTGCCVLAMNDKHYLFIGDKNPHYGYQLKQLLGKQKNDTMIAIVTLESIISKKIIELKDSDNSIQNTQQIEQLTKEIDLVAQAKDCVLKHATSIQDLLKVNLQNRNKTFIEQNPFYKDM